MKNLIIFLVAALISTVYSKELPSEKNQCYSNFKNYEFRNYDSYLFKLDHIKVNRDYAKIIKINYDEKTESIVESITVELKRKRVVFNFERPRLGEDLGACKDMLSLRNFNEIIDLLSKNQRVVVEYSMQGTGNFYVLHGLRILR